MRQDFLIRILANFFGANVIVNVTILAKKLFWAVRLVRKRSAFRSIPVAKANSN